MPLNFEQQRLVTVKRNERELSAMFQRLVTYVQGLIVRNVGSGGVVPANRSDSIRREAGREFTKMMVGLPSQDGHVTPYHVTDGAVTPNSEYMRILWDNVGAITRIAVAQHAAMLTQSLDGAPDIIKALKAAKGNPFAVKQRIAEIGGGGEVYPNPLANYDPLHEWLDKSNARLSDNIWDATTEGRRKLDLYLQDSIAHGMGARDMAGDLERFLVPGRNLIRTNKPYGTNASFDAMRLARTELTSAFTRASSASAQINPFVETYDVVLSGSHPDEDECNDVADGGPYDKTDTENLPPIHPQCLCRPRWNRSATPKADIIARLRSQVATARDEARVGADADTLALVDAIGPMQIEAFSKLLMNPAKPQPKVSENE